MEDRPTDRQTDLGIKAPSRSLKKVQDVLQEHEGTDSNNYNNFEVF